MCKSRVNLFLVLAFVTGVGLGCALLLLLTSQATQAQETQSKPDENRIFVNGNGVADSSKSPPKDSEVPWERFTLFASNEQRRSLKVVPPGKTLIVTDFMYNTRLIRQNLTVNVGKITPDDKSQMLFQIYLSPGGQEQTHLCTGYAIPGGYGVGAWTNAGLEREQIVQIAITGYLIDDAQR